MNRFRNGPSLDLEPCDDVPPGVRAHLQRGVTAPPAVGTAEARAAIARAAERLAEEAPKPGGATHRRDGTPRHSAVSGRGRGTLNLPAGPWGTAA